MDDLAGVLVLLGLVVLAVPILLVMALVSISGLKRRVGDLESAVVLLRDAAGTCRQQDPPTNPQPLHRLPRMCLRRRARPASRPWPN